MIKESLEAAIKIIREKLEEPITPESNTEAQAAYIFGVTSMLIQQIGQEYPSYRKEFQELGTLLDNIY